MAFPELVIANDALKATVYPPDAAKGFYRAMRFDWSGQIARVEFAGHSVFGPFRTEYDALVHDNVVGPAEEFDMYAPPGYAEAGQGGAFVKIGVGVLERTSAEDYVCQRNSPLLEAPPWQVSSGKDWVEMRQVLAHGPWGYSYTKRISLEPAGMAFRISHTLRSTGSRAIDTVPYCHNFTIIDDDPIGPDYVLSFPFQAAVTPNSRGPIVVKDNTLTFPAALGPEDSAWAQFEAVKGTVAENAFAIENTARGVTMRVRGDRPLEMMRFYATATAICPEPFTRISVAPGEEQQWGSTYEFSVKSK